MSMDKFLWAEPCSRDICYHYSWDFAQNVHFPHHAQQVGPIYFCSPRKCHVFGMCAEGSGKQVFYLIDEAELPEKGAESVVSLAHHHFQHFGVGEKHAEIHFDNAVGQNKNHTVIWYAMWRTLTGLHETMSLNCMITGHTKFAPDYHFGIWKLKWRSSNAETMEEIAGSVTASSKSGHNVPQLVQDDNKPVVFFAWKTYLEQFFKPLKNITKYHHFTMDPSKPGIVTCKENMDSEEMCFNILKPLSPAAGELQPTKPAPGLDLRRQWYLYDSISPFFRAYNARDTVCPKPSKPKVKNQGMDSDSLPRKRKHSL
ncbi:uncharacterized protein LOC127849258 [Dreissena polymorpha]|nr:uncharacterized protein LOC127849258 [Dreissena polymorpha]